MCLAEKTLSRSHFLPRGAYRRMWGNDKKELLFVGRQSKIITTQQVQEHVLCAACESRLNAKGEQYTLKNGFDRRDGRFPLLAALRGCPRLAIGGFGTLYAGTGPGVCGKMVAYCAASVIWRAAIREWNLPGGFGKSVKLELGPYEAPLREFLNGEAGWPATMAVTVMVCTDVYSQQTATLPFLGERRDHLFSYEIRMLGINSVLTIGKHIPGGLSRLCAIRSGDSALWVGDRRDDFFRSFVRLTRGHPLGVGDGLAGL